MTTTSPRHRTRASVVALATGLLVSGLGAGTASAQELPSDQIQGAVEDSTEYAGYVAGSVEAFFQLPPDEAIGGSAAAGSLALCFLNPFADDTCAI